MSHRLGLATARRILAVLVDVVVIGAAYYLVLSFRFQEHIPEYLSFTSPRWSVFLLLALAMHLGSNIVFRVYGIVNRYVGLRQALWIVEASGLAVALLVAISVLWGGGMYLMPLSVIVLGGAVATGGMVAMRFYSRVFQVLSLRSVRDGIRVLIVGAGQAADMIIRQVDTTPSSGITVVGLVDDRRELQGMLIHDYKVLGSSADIPRLVKEHEIQEILLCIPSATSEELTRIYEHARPAGVPIKTVPPLAELVAGSVSLRDVRELAIEDLLGRPPVETDMEAVAGYLKDRRVLVTGAAGSIGSELVRQIAAFDPAVLILVDHDESGLYRLHEELRMRGFSRYLLEPTNILQAYKMKRLFHEHHPHVVFHAAAFKHVPLMELAPDEAVLNNVSGTQVVATQAAAARVERFVNISTDKAVDPVSVMGATKRLAEMVVRTVAEANPSTKFCSVRFGNVLGSQGSVIPIFRRQIEEGGPITITHPDMTRYFMSIPEAVQLVLQAASLAGETTGYGAFILEMGEPVRITDLARRMIELMKPGGRDSMAIQYTGLRPGEKLEETLVGSLEHVEPTRHSMISMAAAGPAMGEASRQSDLPPDFHQKLSRLILLSRHHGSRATIVSALQSLLPTYQPFDFRTAGAFPGSGPDEESVDRSLALAVRARELPETDPVAVARVLPETDPVAVARVLSVKDQTPAPPPRLSPED